MIFPNCFGVGICNFGLGMLLKKVIRGFFDDKDTGIFGKIG